MNMLLSGRPGLNLGRLFIIDKLFASLLTLDEQIIAFFEHKSPGQGYFTLIVCCVCVCGSHAKHLCQQPRVCPGAAARLLRMLRT